MQFTAIIELHGKTATGIQIPPEIVEGLQSGKKPQVSVTINGYTYQSTIAVMGGKYLLPVSAEHRELARVKAGDMVEVAIELDTSKREVVVPDDLNAIFDQNPEARKHFNQISFSAKQRIVLHIESAKTPETRQKRLTQTISDLSVL